MKIHHTGIIVDNIDESARLYVQIGYTAQNDIVHDTVQNNKILFLKGEGGDIIELIEPINEKSSVFNLPCGLAHICYETKCLNSFIANFKKQKLGVIFTNPITAPALNNKKIIFAYLKNKNIIEILETGMGEHE